MTKLRRLRLGAAALIALGLVAAGAASPSAAATYDLAGLWLFNEGSGQVAKDLSLSGNNGTLGSTTGPDANDPSRFPLGLLGLRGALHFGGDDYVQVPNAPSLEPDGVIVVARVRAVDPGAYRYVVAKGALNCYMASYGLYTDGDGALRFYMSNGEQYLLSPPYAGLWNGDWHTARGVYDGTSISLWVDGVKVGSTPVTIPIRYDMPESRDLFIGTYPGPCSMPFGFVGDIDGVALIGKYTTSAVDGLVG